MMIQRLLMPTVAIILIYFLTIRKNFCLLTPDCEAVYHTQISAGNLVLMNAQTTVFFEKGTHMAIPHATVMQFLTKELLL